MYKSVFQVFCPPLISEHMASDRRMESACLDSAPVISFIRLFLFASLTRHGLSYRLCSFLHHQSTISSLRAGVRFSVAKGMLPRAGKHRPGHLRSSQRTNRVSVLFAQVYRKYFELYSQYFNRLIPVFFRDKLSRDLERWLLKPLFKNPSLPKPSKHFSAEQKKRAFCLDFCQNRQ